VADALIEPIAMRLGTILGIVGAALLVSCALAALCARCGACAPPLAWARGTKAVPIHPSEGDATDARPSVGNARPSSSVSPAAQLAVSASDGAAHCSAARTRARLDWPFWESRRGARTLPLSASTAPWRQYIREDHAVLSDAPVGGAAQGVRGSTPRRSRSTPSRSLPLPADDVRDPAARAVYTAQAAPPSLARPETPCVRPAGGSCVDGRAVVEAREDLNPRRSRVRHDGACADGRPPPASTASAVRSPRASVAPQRRVGPVETRAALTDVPNGRRREREQTPTLVARPVAARLSERPAPRDAASPARPTRPSLSVFARAQITSWPRQPGAGDEVPRPMDARDGERDVGHLSASAFDTPTGVPADCQTAAEANDADAQAACAPAVAAGIVETAPPTGSAEAAPEREAPAAAGALAAHAAEARARADALAATADALAATADALAATAAAARQRATAFAAALARRREALTAAFEPTSSRAAEGLGPVASEALAPVSTAAVAAAASGHDAPIGVAAGAASDAAAGAATMTASGAAAARQRATTAAAELETARTAAAVASARLASARAARGHAGRATASDDSGSVAH
jgi:hypothetical protein